MRRSLATLIALLCLAAPAQAQYELPPTPEQPELSVNVIRPSGKALIRGQRYTWRIRVRNVGRVTARQVVITARWEGLIAVRGGKIVRAKRRSTFTIKTLATRRSKTFLLSGVVSPTAQRISVRASATFKG
jgi:hypothetical protein